MRSITIVSLAALLCSSHAFAQKTSDVPSNVQSAFSKRYADAAKVKWDKEGARHEASFLYNGKDISVVYNADGTVAETETRIAVTELPAKARTYALAKGKIREAARIEAANGSVRYEAEVKGKDLLFDDQGNLVEEKVEKDQ